MSSLPLSQPEDTTMAILPEQTKNHAEEKPGCIEAQLEAAQMENVKPTLKNMDAEALKPFHELP